MLAMTSGEEARADAAWADLALLVASHKAAGSASASKLASVWAGLVGGSSGEVAASAERMGWKVADRNVLHSTQSTREV